MRSCSAQRFEQAEALWRARMEDHSRRCAQMVAGQAHCNLLAQRVRDHLDAHCTRLARGEEQDAVLTTGASSFNGGHQADTQVFELELQVADSQQVAPGIEDDDWEVFDGEDGIPYYHNIKTGQCVWAKPACLQASSEDGVPQVSEVAALSNASAAHTSSEGNSGSEPVTSQGDDQSRIHDESTDEDRVWEIYETDDTGIPYYYNTNTGECLWEKPANFRTEEVLLPNENTPRADDGGDIRHHSTASADERVDLAAAAPTQELKAVVSAAVAVKAIAAARKVSFARAETNSTVNSVKAQPKPEASAKESTDATMVEAEAVVQATDTGTATPASDGGNVSQASAHSPHSAENGKAVQSAVADAASASPDAEKLALEAELRGLKLSELKKCARKAGVDESKLEEADDADDIKAVVVALIVERVSWRQGHEWKLTFDNLATDFRARSWPEPEPEPECQWQAMLQQLDSISTEKPRQVCASMSSADADDCIVAEAAADAVKLPSGVYQVVSLEAGMPTRHLQVQEHGIRLLDLSGNEEKVFLFSGLQSFAETSDGIELVTEKWEMFLYDTEERAKIIEAMRAQQIAVANKEQPPEHSPGINLDLIETSIAEECLQVLLGDNNEDDTTTPGAGQQMTVCADDAKPDADASLLTSLALESPATPCKSQTSQLFSAERGTVMWYMACPKNGSIAEHVTSLGESPGADSAPQHPVLGGAAAAVLGFTPSNPLLLGKEWTATDQRVAQNATEDLRRAYLEQRYAGGILAIEKAIHDQEIAPLLQRAGRTATNQCLAVIDGKIRQHETRAGRTMRTCDYLVALNTDELLQLKNALGKLCSENIMFTNSLKAVMAKVDADETLSVVKRRDDRDILDVMQSRLRLLNECLAESFAKAESKMASDQAGAKLSDMQAYRLRTEANLILSPKRQPVRTALIAPSIDSTPDFRRRSKIESLASISPSPVNLAKDRTPSRFSSRGAAATESEARRLRQVRLQGPSSLRTPRALGRVDAGSARSSALRTAQTTTSRTLESRSWSRSARSPRTRLFK